MEIGKTIISITQTLLSIVFFIAQIRLVVGVKMGLKWKKKLLGLTIRRPIIFLRKKKSLNNMIRENKILKYLMYLAGSFVVLEIIKGVFFNSFNVVIFVIWGLMSILYFLRYKNKF